VVILKRLYSETKLFDEITFKQGINLIIGNYDNIKPDERTGINGIGKSTVVRLIDYAFIGESSKKHFDVKKHSFLEGQKFSLEIEINSKNHTITRLFGKNVVYIGKTGGIADEFSETQAKKLLNTLFFEKDTFEGYIGHNWFRPLIKFFVKDDLNSNKRWDPLCFNHTSDSEALKLSYNFFLLGISINNIYDYYLNTTEKKELVNAKKTLEGKIKDDTGKEIGQFKSEKIETEKKINILRESIKEYEFLENYKEIETKLKDISRIISGELSKLNILDKKLDNCRKSYKLDLEIDIKKVERLYKEIDVQIGEFVKKSLEDVINFRKEISDNRKRFLSERERELSNEINGIYDKISTLESERVKLYKMLDEKQALSSLKNAYELMIEEKAKLERNEANANRIDELEKSITGKQKKIDEDSEKIIDELNTKSKEKINKLSELFGNIVSNAIFVNENSEDKSFYIRGVASTARKKNPVEFTINVPKSDALGNSRFKILAYDLTVFLNLIANNRELPRFLLHDGVFHGISRETIINVLNYMYSQSLQYKNIQYIVTANKEEIITPGLPEYLSYNFNLEDMVIADYSDIPEKMIFKRTF
jgi:uncharacterized protein YydD (DUF2326 family)